MNLISERKTIKSVTTPSHIVELSEGNSCYYVSHSYNGPNYTTSDVAFVDYKTADIVFNKVVSLFIGGEQHDA